MIQIVPLLALAVHTPQSPDFEIVHRAVLDQDVAFVHVESETPDVRLGVYSDDTLITIWPPGAPVGEPVSLGPGDRFYVNELNRMLAIAHVEYPCLDGSSVSGLAQFTQLRFPRPILPPVPPTVPQPPQPNPPPPVDGANGVHISADAALIVFVRTQRASDLPTTVTVFRLPDPSAGSYELTGTYVNQGQGVVRTSLGGTLIAQRERRQVRLMSPSGAQLARLTLEGQFDLAPDARWLARTTPVRAVFDELDAQGRPTGLQVSLPTASAPIGVDMLSGSLALVRERGTVTLFDVASQQPAWTRSTADGVYVSADLVELAAGRRVVALGKRELLTAPSRRGGVFVPGQARATVEVIDAGNDQVLTQTSLLLSRWDHGVPQVLFVGSPPRLLVTSPESVLISQAIQ